MLIIDPRPPFMFNQIMTPATKKNLVTAVNSMPVNSWRWKLLLWISRRISTSELRTNLTRSMILDVHRRSNLNLLRPWNSRIGIPPANDTNFQLQWWGPYNGLSDLKMMAHGSQDLRPTLVVPVSVKRNYENDGKGLQFLSKRRLAVAVRFLNAGAEWNLPTFWLKLFTRRKNMSIGKYKTGEWPNS